MSHLHRRSLSATRASPRSLFATGIAARSAVAALVSGALWLLIAWALA